MENIFIIDFKNEFLKSTVFLYFLIPSRSIIFTFDLYEIVVNLLIKNFGNCLSPKLMALSAFNLVKKQFENAQSILITHLAEV